MANTKLTNQRQVFVEDYVCSVDLLKATNKAAGYKDTHTLVIRLVRYVESVQMK